jgi:hypothetical protein
MGGMLLNVDIYGEFEWVQEKGKSKFYVESPCWKAHYIYVLMRFSSLTPAISVGLYNKSFYGNSIVS